MRKMSRGRRVSLATVLLGTTIALGVVVLPAFGVIGPDVAPQSAKGVMPTLYDTGGQSNDCELFASETPAVPHGPSKYRIDSPKSQPYTTSDGVTITLKLVSNGPYKDKRFSWTMVDTTGKVTGLATDIGVKGGTQTTWYAISNPASYKDSSLPFKGLLSSDGDGSTGDLHAPYQSTDKPYSVSNVTFCYTPAATVGGITFDDRNGNKQPDNGEGIPNRTVYLQTTSGTQVGDPFVTGTDGAFTFVAPLGNYKVCVLASASWGQTFPDSQTDGSVSCGSNGGATSSRSAARA